MKCGLIVMDRVHEEIGRPCSSHGKKLYQHLFGKISIIYIVDIHSFIAEFSHTLGSFLFPQLIYLLSEELRWPESQMAHYILSWQIKESNLSTRSKLSSSALKLINAELKTQMAREPDDSNYILSWQVKESNLSARSKLTASVLTTKVINAESKR